MVNRASNMRDTRRIAFLTMDSLANFVAYDHLAIPPLAELGWQVVDVPWRDSTVDWNDFAAVVIRTPWDYHFQCEEFLDVLTGIDRSRATLLNPLDIVRWNIDKRYLHQLQCQGISTVPTLWNASPSKDYLMSAFSELSCDELVIKPTIGAGARDTFRLRRDSDAVCWQTIIHTYRDRPVMVQPFLNSIVSRGEWSLFFFAGEYSHTILKTPKPGDFRVQEEYGSRLSSIEPTPKQYALAKAALGTIGRTLLYGRVDIVELPFGEPAVIELELIEPSLYFPYDAESPRRFARALDGMLLNPCRVQ